MSPTSNRPNRPFDPTDPAYDPSEGDFEAARVVHFRSLLALIASNTGQTQATVASILDAFESVVEDAVANGSKVTLAGWLAIERVETAARTGRNPQTGQEIKIPAGKRVKVTVGSKLKAAVK